MKRNQSGFTLIEIAIVLVIIGLLLGGVLKGQELINSARVKNLAGDFKNIPVFIYGYQDKFRALPGDDIQAVSHVGAAAADVGNGNGRIEGNWYDAATVNSEAVYFWSHVRLANLAPGPTDRTAADYIPKNAAGGNIGIVGGGGTSPITSLRGSYIICSTGILGKFARQIDLTLDNGDTTTGSMMAASGVPTTNGVTAAAIPATNDDDPFTLCMGF